MSDRRAENNEEALGDEVSDADQRGQAQINEVELSAMARQGLAGALDKMRTVPAHVLVRTLGQLVLAGSGALTLVARDVAWLLLGREARPG